MKKSQALKLYRELGFNLNSFTNEIKKKGFQKIGEGAYKLIYSKNKLGYVIKIAHSVNDEFSKASDKIKKFYIQPYFCDKHIVIQDKANTKFGASKRAYEIFKKKFGKTYCESWDVYEDNCGEVNNEPVLFDYCEIPSRK